MLRAGRAEQLDGGGIEIGEAAFGLNEDGVRRVFDQGAELLLAGQQGGEHLLALHFGFDGVEGEADVAGDFGEQPLFLGIGRQVAGQGDNQDAIDMFLVADGGGQGGLIGICSGEGAGWTGLLRVGDDDDPRLGEGPAAAGRPVAALQLRPQGFQVAGAVGFAGDAQLTVGRALPDPGRTVAAGFGQ